MSLPPGTRIPSLTPYEQELLDDAKVATHVAEALMVAESRSGAIEKAYWRGYRLAACIWGPLGITLGSIVTACALALAWAHMGG